MRSQLNIFNCNILASYFGFKYDHTEEIVRPWDKQKRL